MKKLIPLILALSILALPTSAAVSPGLDVIAASDLRMTKNCLRSGSINFTADDFDAALGVKKLASVTVTSLPLVTEGRLMLGNLEVMKNQTISRKNLDNLRFVPNASTNADVSECSFTFVGGDYEVECTMFVLDELNFAPTVALSDKAVFECTTQRGISTWGRLSAYDPEGDSLSFEIVSYPKKGVIDLTRDTGDYVYTPTAGYVGSDSFTYVAVDCYGNRSDEARVSLRVEKPACDVRYDDMDGHWAENAAIKMTAAGIMNGKSDNGVLCFDPNGGVSRLEFLVMAMQAADIAPYKAVDTGFYDDADIPSAFKGYVAAATARGIVSGIELDGLRCFCPNNAVTRAEAAVMLRSILSPDEPKISAVFADSDSVPAWAESAMMALNAIGILSGTGDGYISPYATLTRAQTAQMLMKVMD